MRIQFDQGTPLGATRITLQTDESGLSYETGPPLNQGLQVPWSSITTGGTAVLELPTPTAAMPAVMAAYMGRREMLVLGYRDVGGRTRQVSIPLPSGIPRDAVVNEARNSLGTRWVGEALPMAQVATRLGTRNAKHTAGIWFFIAAIAVFAFVALIVGASLAVILFNPYMLCIYAFAGGAALFRRGFLEYRNRLAVEGTPTAKADSAAIGLAELSGRARGKQPTPAAASGTPSVFWRVEVRQWKRSQKGEGQWHTLLKRQSDPLEIVELEDETGSIPVWAHGAELILKSQYWRSRKEPVLPEPCRKLLAEIGTGWPAASDPNHMEVTETRLEEGGPLYVMGTLAECWRIQAAIGSGAAGVTNVPPPVHRAPAASLSAIPGLAWKMLRVWLRNKIRGKPLSAPALDPQCVVVWKGDQGRPFIIADRPERETLKSLSKRMWASILAGAGLMLGALYFVLDTLFRSATG